MDSFETSWPSPPGGIETLSNDGIQMDLVSDLQESFEPLQRARYVQLNYFKQITFEWIDSIDERINSFEDFFFLFRSNTWPLPRPENYTEPEDSGSNKCSNQQLANSKYI